MVCFLCFLGLVLADLATLASKYGCSGISDPKFAVALDDNDPLRHVKDEYWIPLAADVVSTAQDPNSISSLPEPGA